MLSGILRGSRRRKQQQDGEKAHEFPRPGKARHDVGIGRSARILYPGVEHVTEGPKASGYPRFLRTIMAI